MKHIVGVIVLIGVMTIATATWLSNTNLLPMPASAEALPIDWLFGLHLQVIAFLFALIIGFMIYSIVAFRRKPGENGDGEHIHGNSTLEIVWTVVPLGVVLYFGYLGALTLNDIIAPAENELVVEVTASQWSWRFDYPEAEISSTVLNLPLGRTTVFEMISMDVIHSFWVPEFRVKQDTVPGMVKSLRVTPTELGTFKIRCAELCGTDHAYMLAEVNVLTPKQFDEWMDEELEALAAAEAGPILERGSTLSELQGCVACHSTDGSDGNGPTWLGLYGHEVSLADGSTVTADDDYLRNSIINPGEQIVEGFNNIMPPTYGDTLTEEEIELLVEYIEALAENNDE
jgi:cytochrome c oxidase subunit 2